MADDLPVIMPPEGATPTPPSILRAALTTEVSKTNPGYTNNLPGTLVEDIASTDVQALTMMDRFRVECLNDLTPYGCNEFVLVLLGKVYGVPIGVPVNTSVFVIFTGLPGFVIGKGFIVGDGTHQYVVQDGGIVTASGFSPLLYCVATSAGAWAVPAATVTNLITPPPSGFTLSVSNPEPGIPAKAAETSTQYRSRVLMAGLAASQGMARYLRTLLGNVDGVDPRLIGIQQQEGGGWMILVGGGDPYEVAYAIYTALFDISTLVGAQIDITAITSARPATITTLSIHGLRTGDPITIENSDPPDYDGSFEVLDTPSLTTLTYGTPVDALPLDPAALPVWVGGGTQTITFTTVSPHALVTGDPATTSGCAPNTYNAIWPAVIVVSPTVFTVHRGTNPGLCTTVGQVDARIEPFDATGLPAYVEGAFMRSTKIDVTVSITDFPDTYQITYVTPPLQTVTGTVTWNSNGPNIVAPAAVAQAAGPALAKYINSILVGAPINLLQMEDAFATAIAGIIPPQYLTVLIFALSIDGHPGVPTAGTKIIEGDPQGYFFSAGDGTDFTIVQG